MRRRPLCLLCLVVIGVLYCMQLLGIPLTRDSSDIRAVDELVETPFTAVVEGEVVRCEARDDYTVLLLAHSSLFHYSGHYQLNNVRVTLGGAAGHPVGSLVRVRGTLERPPGATNPGQFDRAAWYALQGIRFIMKGKEVRVVGRSANPFGVMCAVIRQKLSERVRAVFPADVAGILGAMLVGDKALLDPDETSLYRLGGVSHVLAISGLHITLLGMGFFRILRGLRVKLAPAAVLSVGALVVYAFVTGLSVSTVRAAIMFGLVMLAKLTGRTYDMPTSMAIACLLIVIENPLWTANAGFLLSFTAVAVICLFGGRSPFASGAILYVCMLPVVLGFYYEIPLYSVPVNLVVVPLMPFVLGLGILGLVLGGSFHWPATLLIRLLHFLLDQTARLPAVSLILGRPRLWQVALYAVLAILFLWGITVWRTDRRRFLLYAMVPLMVCIFLIRPREGMRTIFMDVGQGDGCVLELPDGANILVDGGSSSVNGVGTWRILPCLKYEGIRRLDYVVVTHLDGDHTSGIVEILETVRDHRTSLRVGTVVLPYRSKPSEAWRELALLAQEAGARVVMVSAGDVFIFGEGENETIIRVLGPDPSAEGAPIDENAQSTVLGVHYGWYDCLLTGDVQGAGEEALIKVLAASGEDFDVLKVAHHGSRFSTPEEFLELCHPAVSVISAGEKNLYGHPSDEVLERLASAGSRIFRTDLEGAVTVETDGQVFYVSGFNESAHEAP